MIRLEGEITETACPPNGAATFRSVSIWFPHTEETVEITLFLEEMKRAGIKEGDKVNIQIEKIFDIDSITPSFFENS